MAIVWPEPEFTPDEAMAHLQTVVEDAIARHILNRLCAVCGATEFHYEDGVSKFRTMEEAMPAMREQEMKQLLSQSVLRN